MPMPEYFVLNDETKKNSHGFRLLNAGAVLDRFNDNPVMLDSHDMKSVIGRWDNLRFDGTKMLASPVFDVDDEIGKKIAGKVDRGFLKAASLGIYILDAKYIETLEGEAELVVTKYEILEASVLGVPSNSGAIAFYAENGVQLSAETVLSTVQNLAAPTKPQTINPTQIMEKIILSAEAATALGVAVEHAEMTAINAAVTTLAARATEAENKLTNFNKERATTMVELAIAEGRLEATRRESFTNLAIADFKQATEIIGALPAKKEMGANLRTGETGVHTERANWDYMKWAKEDPNGLAELQAKQPQEFNKLRESYQPKFS